MNRNELRLVLQLISGMFSLMLVGSTFCFSLFAPTLKSQFRFTERDVSFIASAAVIGSFSNQIAGPLFDLYGARFTLATGGVLLVTAWMLLHNLVFSVVADATPPSVALVAALFFAAMSAASFLELATLMSALELLRLHYGIATVLTKTQIGLGSSVISLLFAAIFSGGNGDGSQSSVSHFCSFLAITSGVIAFIAAIVTSPIEQTSNGRCCGYLTKAWDVRVVGLNMLPMAPPTTTMSPRAAAADRGFREEEREGHQAEGATQNRDDACVTTIDAGFRNVALLRYRPFLRRSLYILLLSIVIVTVATAIQIGASDRGWPSLVFVVIAVFCSLLPLTFLQLLMMLPNGPSTYTQLFTTVFAASPFSPMERERPQPHAGQGHQRRISDSNNNNVQEQEVAAPTPRPAIYSSPSSIAASNEHDSAAATATIPDGISLQTRIVFMIEAMLGKTRQMPLNDISHEYDDADMQLENEDENEEEEQQDKATNTTAATTAVANSKMNNNTLLQNLFCSSSSSSSMFLLIFIMMSTLLGSMSMVYSNVASLFHSLQSNDFTFSSARNAAFVGVFGLGNAAGRACAGLSVKSLTARARPVYFLLRLAPLCNAMGLALFSVVRGAGLVVPFVICGFAVGWCWSAMVMMARRLFLHSGSFYSFLYVAGAAGTLGFLQLFPYEYELHAERQATAALNVTSHNSTTMNSTINTTTASDTQHCLGIECVALALGVAVACCLLSAVLTEIVILRMDRGDLDSGLSAIVPVDEQIVEEDLIVERQQETPSRNRPGSPGVDFEIDFVPTGVAPELM